MTRDKIKEALLAFVWVETPSLAPTYILSDVANAVNAAFQTIWLAPHDHYRRKNTTLSTVASTQAYTLTPANVQEILNPVKIGAKQLRPIKHRGDFDHYATRYLGATSDPAAEGQPVAYYVERRNNAGTADLSAISIYLTPTPDAVYTVTYDYVGDAPTYTVSQMADATALEFPHQYVESIFLPLARYFMMNSHFFHESDANRGAFAKEEYLAAMKRLGYSNPQVADVTGGGKEVSK